MLPLIQSSYFQNLINGFPDGVIIFNIDGVAYVANASAQRLLGLEEQDILGSRWETLCAPFAGGEALAAYLDAARACPPGELEARAPAHAQCRLADGRTRHLSCTTSHIIEYGKLFGILLAITDVSHIFEMHERERQMLEERRALEQERARSLEHFSMAVAHQIRNPVMTIAGFSRLLLRKAEPESNQFELLEAILDGGVRLNAIVRAVSEYTALQLGEPEPVDLRDCCHNALQELHLEFQQQAQPEQTALPRWELLLPDAPCMLSGNAALLTQAVLELLRNAAEAALQGSSELPATPEIRLRLEAQDGRLELGIEDNGPGVTAADLPYVFDPFFTTKPVGVGMGLCKVQRILREHQGLVVLENRAGTHGAQARVTLPSALLT
ncbi:two-component system sensor histidine kinase NtrB [Megalodesulfovibrio paquesii]